MPQHLTEFQQAISWTNVDLDSCRHMTSLGQNELLNGVYQSSLMQGTNYLMVYSQ